MQQILSLFVRRRASLSRWGFGGLLVASLFLSPAAALFAGILLSFTVGTPAPRLAGRVSKYLLQGSVVGLGFGMNLHASLAAGREGMLFTVISVAGVMVLGVALGRLLRLGRKHAYLISAGTAICGGSAIAAIAPVVDADENETSLALATVFVLNAVALFLFPPVGRLLGLTQEQFGMWAAIAIHDTSSVVGAGAAYGEQALAVATTVKLTRALWIIPLAFVSTLVFRQKGRKVSVPWFILLFVAAMLLNTYAPLPAWLTTGIVALSRRALCATLFLIGCGLSLGVIRSVGLKPLGLGAGLWAIISLGTLAVVLATA